MKLTSKVLINVRDKDLEDVIRKTADKYSIWVRIVDDTAPVPDVCVVFTDHTWAPVKSNVVWVVYRNSSTESSIAAASEAGYRSILIRNKSVDLCDVLPMLYLRDSARSTERHTSIDVNLVSDKTVYENRDFKYNFGEGSVVRKASGNELYFTRAQIYWMYRRLVKHDRRWNRSQGTRLMRKYGREVLFPVTEHFMSGGI